MRINHLEHESKESATTGWFWSHTFAPKIDCLFWLHFVLVCTTL